MRNIWKRIGIMLLAFCVWSLPFPFILGDTDVIPQLENMTTQLQMEEDHSKNDSTSELLPEPGEDPEEKPKPIPPETIELSQTSLKFTDLKASEMLAVKDIPEETKVTWSSSNPQIVTVDEDGKVVPIKNGVATITATLENGAYAVCTVEVAIPVNATSIVLDKTETTLSSKNATVTIYASVRPEDAQNKVIWSSEDDSIASVSSTGVVTAHDNGVIYVFATSADGKATAKCKVTVNIPTIKMQNIAVSQKWIQLDKPGDMETLFTSYWPRNATNKEVRWLSSDTNVVRVDGTGYAQGNGVVKAVGNGSAIVTATSVDGGIKASCLVAVGPIEKVQKIKLNKISLQFQAKGSAELLTAKVLPENATNTNILWSSSNPKIATVDTNGLVTAVADGSAIITAESQQGKIQAYCTVTVKSKSGMPLTVTVLGNNNGNQPANVTKDQLAKAAGTGLKVATTLGAVYFDAAAVKSLADQSAGTSIQVSILSVGDVKVEEESSEIFGDRPIVKLYVAVGNKPIESIGGNIQLQLPYHPNEGEREDGLAGYTIENGDQSFVIPQSVYREGKLLMKVNGPGVYAVGYQNNIFRDSRAHWGSDGICFVSSHGIFAGTGDQLFSPNEKMTRGMLAVTLARISGATFDQPQTMEFEDVKENRYDANAIAWSVQNGILEGIKAADEKLIFAPDQFLSREELALVLYRYIQYEKMTFAKNEDSIAFRDEYMVHSWAAKSVLFMRQTGLMRGDGNGFFRPQETMTRVEIASILQRIVKESMREK